MYTLIIIVFFWSGAGGRSIAIDHVPGFWSEEACRVQAKKLQFMDDEGRQVMTFCLKVKSVGE